MLEFFTIFLNVILPVFAIVMLAALLGGRLKLQAQTLTRASYYVFSPAFIFLSIGQASLTLGDAAQMVLYIVAVHVLAIIVAAGLAWLLKLPKAMAAAFVILAMQGNTGNYGLAVVRFQLGDGAMASATIYFVVLSMMTFALAVSIAGWARGGGSGMVSSVLKAPVLWAAAAAIVVSVGDIEVPLMIQRMVSILADGMIPVTLFALGLQLFEQRRIQLSPMVLTACGAKLVLTPLIAFLLMGLFPLSGIQQASGVLQSAMPGAIMASIIAKEHDLVPDFITSVVVVSTCASVLTLSVWMIVL